MYLVLLLQDLVGLPWDKLLAGAQGVLVLTIILIFFLRIAPTWKEVKMRDFDVREAEAKSSVTQSEATKALSESTRLISDVLYKVAVEQRRAADSVKILQRVNSRNIGDFEDAISTHEDRLAELEKNATNATTANQAAA